MTPEQTKMVEKKAKYLQEFINKQTRDWVTTVTCLKLARHVMALEIRAEIKGVGEGSTYWEHRDNIVKKLEAQLKELE